MVGLLFILKSIYSYFLFIDCIPHFKNYFCLQFQDSFLRNNKSIKIAYYYIQPLHHVQIKCISKEFIHIENGKVTIVISK